LERSRHEFRFEANFMAVAQSGLTNLSAVTLILGQPLSPGRLANPQAWVGLARTGSKRQHAVFIKKNIFYKGQNYEEKRK